MILKDLAGLIGHQLDLEDQLDVRDALLLGAEEAALLREQLIGIVSHDLRNPLAAISLAAGSLMQRTDLDDRARRAVLRILHACQRSNRLIRDLLDFTQARMGKRLPVQPQQMDLHVLAAQFVEEARLDAPKRSISHKQHGSAGGEWDPDRLAQVVMNLLSNALQYSPVDSAIEVMTRGEPDAVFLEVHNGGAPIPPSLLGTIFEPMTRGGQEGTERRSIGLGLFIVSEIARAHHGSVEVTSNAQAGTRFVVRLPRSSRLALNG